MSYQFFDKELLQAKLVKRPNRFVVHIEIDGSIEGASLPNPGKLGELFVHRCTLLVYEIKKAEAKYKYRVAGVISPHGKTIMLDTHVNNSVANYLLKNHMIPSLAQYDVVRREVSYGKSRFDFLLTNGSEELYCEVKSCTLFHKRVAMFPDAVTERGRRHVEELGQIARDGIKTIVLFIIQSDELTTFLPDFHTDPAFAQTLYENRELVSIVPVAIGWDKKLNLLPHINELTIPWSVYEKHGADSGFYLFLVSVDKCTVIDIGSTLTHTFMKGYYLYVGSAKKALSKRVARHKRTRKNRHWHMDYLREKSSVVQSWPIRVQGDYECEIAQQFRLIADSEVSGFGSSDCTCSSHLFFFRENPTKRIDFQELILTYRMERILI